jgi:hypothetical protein
MWRGLALAALLLGAAGVGCATGAKAGTGAEAGAEIETRVSLRGVAGAADVEAGAGVGAEIETRVTLRGVGGAPVAQGQGGSARLSAEPLLVVKRGDWELRAQPRLRWLRMAGQERRDLDWRTLAVQWRAGDHQLSLGAQQVNWGRMDLVRVSDTLNPIDQHDLFHEELPEAKLALWMLNWEWQRDDQTLQLVLTPQVPMDRLVSPLQGLPVHTERPAASWRNASVGLRYGFALAGWNADLVAVHGWRSMPTLALTRDAQGLRLQGRPERQDSLGFSADKPLGPAVLRLEGVYMRSPGSADSRGSAGSAGSPGGAVAGGLARRELALGAGLDLSPGDWFVAAQLIAQRRLDDRPDALAARDSGYASLVLQRKWLQDRLSTRLTHLHDLRGGSSWSALRVAWELDAHTVLLAQADVFRGRADEALGAFRARSRVALGLELRY